MKNLKIYALTALCSYLGALLPATGGPITTILFQTIGKYSFADANLYGSRLVLGLSIGSLGYRVFDNWLDVRLNLVLPLMICTLGGVLIANAYVERKASAEIQRLYSLVLIVPTLYMLWRGLGGEAYGFFKGQPYEVIWTISDFVAMFAGISARFFNIGGGAFFLSLFPIGYGLSAQEAIGSSFCLSIASLWVSARLQKKAYEQLPGSKPVIFWTAVILGVPGAWSWKKLAQLFPMLPVERAFSFMLFFVFLSLMIYSAWRASRLTRS